MTTMNRAACKACGTPIFWVKNENQKPEPFDARPTRILRVAGDRDPDGVPHVFLEAGKICQIQAGHLNHFLTCPQAAKFRQKPKEETHEPIR
ncbi:MAG TPA: hypothetical protein VG457_02925 [Planctomycetota bacterium]|jgi:hypothetical protein|nr:hypothetical protein [Planctomycetota bacterium]